MDTRVLALAPMAVGVALLTAGITFTGGLVDFEAADNTAIETGVTNGLSNLWAGFSFILPYLGIAAGVIMVIAFGMWLARGRFSR